MPQEELFINGKDAYTTWGISMDDTALSALIRSSLRTRAEWSMESV